MYRQRAKRGGAGEIISSGERGERGPEIGYFKSASAQKRKQSHSLPTFSPFILDYGRRSKTAQGGAKK